MANEKSDPKLSQTENNDSEKPVSEDEKTMTSQSAGPELNKEETLPADTEINQELLQAAIGSQPLMPGRGDIRESLENTSQLVEEVAEDMLEVRKRLKQIETQQAGMITRLEIMTDQTRDSNRAMFREMALLRDTVGGEQKGALTRGAFNAVVTCLDFLHSMKSGLDVTDDELTIRQLKAVELSLKSAVQGLGFVEFKVTPGEPYDPARMECLGYEEGVADQVTHFSRPGYAIGNIVIRPAGVMIASPETQEDLKTKEGSRE